jgi:hypothetical protein
MMKNKPNRKVNRGLAYTTLCILFFALAFSSVQAQKEAQPGTVRDILEDQTTDASIEEIISALNAGGLASDQKIPELNTSSQGQTFAGSISSNETVEESENPQMPAFNADSLKELETLGGLSSAPQISSDKPTVFNLAVRFFEKVVFKKDVEFAGRPEFDDGLDISGTPTFDKSTAGYAIIKKGNQSVIIDFDEKYDFTPVVTATLSLQQYEDPDVRTVAEDLLLVSDVKYIVTNVTKKGFEIAMDRAADSDIPFSWHALAVRNPEISNKAGESLKSKLDAALNPASFDIDSSDDSLEHSETKIIKPNI